MKKNNQEELTFNVTSTTTTTAETAVAKTTTSTASTSPTVKSIAWINLTNVADEKVKLELLFFG